MSIKVKDQPNLARLDENSAVIVNLDQEGFFSYIERRNSVLEDKNKIKDLESQISELKEMIKSSLKLDKNE